MKNIKFFKGRAVLALLLVTIIFGCSGCWFFSSPEADMLSYALEQQKANNKDPQTASGTVNIVKEEITGSTGDKEADAGLGVVKFVMKYKKAEAIMEQARKERSNEGMLKAIDMFPKDWTYRNSKYILDLEQNSTISADRQRVIAEQFAKQIPGSYDKLLTRRIDEFKNVISNRENNELLYGKDKQLFIPGTRGSNLYQGLSYAYEERYKRFKNPQDQEEAKYYRQRADKATRTPEY